MKRAARMAFFMVLSLWPLLCTEMLFHSQLELYRSQGVCLDSQCAECSTAHSSPLIHLNTAHPFPPYCHCQAHVHCIPHAVALWYSLLCPPDIVVPGYCCFVRLGLSRWRQPEVYALWYTESVHYGHLVTASHCAVTNHGIDQQLQDKLFEQFQLFFSQPVEEKVSQWHLHRTAFRSNVERNVTSTVFVL